MSLTVYYALSSSFDFLRRMKQHFLFTYEKTQSRVSYVAHSPLRFILFFRLLTTNETTLFLRTRKRKELSYVRLPQFITFYSLPSISYKNETTLLYVRKNTKSRFTYVCHSPLRFILFLRLLTTN